jgi:hypothetical protein
VVNVMHLTKYFGKMSLMSVLRVDICQTPMLRFIYKEKQTKGVNMTQLTEQLFSTIVHDFHNGGVKSSYGLDTYTRKEVLAYLIRSKGCECINCL